MQKPRERDSKDKIKRKGGGRVQTEARRQLTAKFRKELAQRQRGDSETYETQAVDQVEELSEAAAEEVGQQTKRGAERAGKAIRQQRQEKRGEKRRDTKAPTTGPSDMPTATGQTAPPAPRERGRQKAVKEYREEAQHKARGRNGLALSYSNFQYAQEPQKEIRSLKNQSINQSIKERPRRSFSPKEKPSGGAFAPRTRQSVEQTAQSAAAPTRTAISDKAPPTKAMMECARKRSQREAQQKMLQNTTRKTKNTAYKLGGMTVQVGKVVGKAVASAASSITALGGGAVVLVLLLTVILVAAIVASPFGILFSGESRELGTVPISAAVAQVHYDFNTELEALQTAEDYDTITVTGQAADWVEILAIFAVKVAGSDTDAADVATIDADRIDRLKAVFWDMTTIEHEVEVIRHPGTEDEDGWTERKLYITISAKTAEEMKTAYHFNRHQITALKELLAQRELLLELIEDTYAISGDTAALIQNLPDDLSPEREAVVRTACSLAGKVNYFWGGKSSAIGWDSRWGTLMQVTAAGSPTTGTYRPYGLDCSGFVDWVFNNAHGYVIGHGGGAIMQHRYCTNISWEDAQPGDLVFYPEDTHVGIVGGWDEAGNIQIIHCSSGYNNVVITGKEGFTSVARPNYYTS